VFPSCGLLLRVVHLIRELLPEPLTGVRQQSFVVGFGQLTPRNAGCALQQFRATELFLLGQFFVTIVAVVAAPFVFAACFFSSRMR